jgi:hypothetical protein
MNELTPEDSLALANAPPAPTLITLEELTNTIDVIKQKEATDKSLLLSAFDVDLNMLRDALMKWATAGFPYVYCLFTIDVSPPPKCSDGITRSVYDYIGYVTETSVTELMQRISQKTTGIEFSQNTDSDHFRIYVSKL